jgi:nicotinamidase-related amidase
MAQESASNGQPALRPALPGVLRLRLRSRVALCKGQDEWDEVTLTKDLPVNQTALLLCDVWDRHWCRGATERVDQMAPRMDEVVGFLRAHGVQILHAPSDTMDFYADTPHRRRLAAAPRVEPPEPLPLSDPPLPIDDSDGGCDTGETHQHKAWHRQHPAIEIAGYDGISDNGREIYSLFQQLGVRNMLIMGVHTNMCVLGRSFGIRQMTRWGVRCALVRDLTDAMYNPAKPPHVSHREGTDLVIQHIEKYWCPTVLSEDMLSVHR